MIERETHMKPLLIAVGILVLIFFAPLLGIVFGAFAGWVVGLFFPHTLDLVGQRIFGEAIPAWQLGAALGFVGAFFKSTTTRNKN